MEDLDPIALATAIAEAQAQTERPGVLSRLLTAISGSDADPTAINMRSAGLGLPPAKAAQMVALMATTRSPDRLRSGILAIEPDAEFDEDEAGRLIAILPTYRDGERTGQWTRVYPNEPGFGLTEGMQAAGAVALATPVGRGLRALGVPTTGMTGAAAIGATEAALVEGASSGLTGAPFQVTDVPLGALGGVAGQRLLNVVGSLVSAAQRSGAEAIIGPDGRLLPGPARFVEQAGLDPDQVTEAVAREIQAQVRAGIKPSAAAVAAQSRGLPVEVPMTQGQITGSKGQQLAEDVMASGGMGSLAERRMQDFRLGQQQALQENVGAIAERLAPGTTPISKGEGGALAQQALVAARAGDQARANELYAQARASGFAAVEPDEAMRITDAARSTYREGFDPITAPRMDQLLLRLDEIMANGGDVQSLQTWRRQVSNLRSGAPDVEGAAASAVLRQFDEQLKNAVDNQLLIGDQAAVDAWQNAIRNYAEYANTWQSRGGILNILTEQVTRDGQRQLRVPPESAANAIFTMTASGLARQTGLPRDLLTLKRQLPEAEWNALRQEAFIRLMDTTRGAFRGSEQQFSGVNFKRALENLRNDNPGVMNALFTREEQALFSQFANVAARATNVAINASNTANTAAGLIPRIASAMAATGAGQFAINSFLGKAIQLPYGAARAAGATAQRNAPRQIVDTPRAAAVGAGTGAALSQEEELGPRIPITGRMTIGGQQ
jgi:hypothetical protein